MSGFWFRLDRLLHLRLQMEPLRAQELGEALRDEEQHRLAQAEAEAALARSQSQIHAGETGPDAAVPAGTLRILGLALQAAARDVEAKQKDHQASAEVVEQSQTELGKARQERDVLVKLRGRSHHAWSRDVSRAEQKETDELSQLKWQSRGES